ncbi:MAG: hypothetical protein CBD63_00270 [Candidatus Pelagibacter sp. TMED203]|nr:MAG: hypothetical protein CBD63_00270 [Candidatus Pelagibacter sp. TMED203]|tara:strand:- start:377 stop:697 length:321 start_codon:yes stop_codon:yes gene_type:complete
MDKIYIKLIPNADKQPGDNRPSFVAPPNLKRPDKNWKIGVEVKGKWYSQAAFDATEEDGTPTGGLNVVLTPSDSKAPQSGSGGQQPAMGGYKKPYQKTGTYGNYRR